MLSVSYYETLSSQSCVSQDVESATYTAYCVEGVAEVSVYISTANGIEAEPCEECQAPMDTAVGSVAFYFQVPCEVECEDVVAPSPAPTLCEDRIAEPDWLETVGANFDHESGYVEIVAHDTDSVSFKVNELWEGEVKMLSVRYDESLSSSVCIQQSDPVGTYTAHCVEGTADISIYVVIGDGYEVELCEECQAPASTSDAMAAYYFELPCEVICDDTSAAGIPPPAITPLPDCFDGTVLHARNGEDGLCTDAGPIEVTQTDGDTVEFTLENSWHTLDSIYMEYEPALGDESTCVSFTNAPTGILGDYSAKCTDGIAYVNIYLVDSLLAESVSEPVPAVCSGRSNPSDCYYSYALSCGCGARSVRRMDDLSSKESFTSEEMAAGAHIPSENDDVPYCVSEDFPCEGEGSDMVHVCHYSARNGYQTFCIPESDSDILRFYPNDYCGPCEGGYGGVWS